jgi:hypothetical protein
LGATQADGHRQTFPALWQFGHYAKGILIRRIDSLGLFKEPLGERNVVPIELAIGIEEASVTVQ